MKKTHIILTLLFLSTCFYNNALAQTAEVTVGGLVAKPYKINAQTFASMKRVSASLTGHDGKSHQYSGVSLYEILTKAEAIPNNLLKGKLMVKYVLITAADKYQVVIALPEIDPAFTDQVIILADEQDGEKLPANLGPYRLVVPQDKKQARSVRCVTAIKLQDANMKLQSLK